MIEVVEVEFFFFFFFHDLVQISKSKRMKRPETGRTCWTLKACTIWAFGCCNNSCSPAACISSFFLFIWPFLFRRCWTLVRKKAVMSSSRNSLKTLLLSSGRFSQLCTRHCPWPTIKSRGIIGKKKKKIAKAIFIRLISEEAFCRAGFLTGSTWPQPLPASPISINMRKVKWSHLMNSSQVSSESIKFIRLAASAEVEAPAVLRCMRRRLNTCRAGGGMHARICANMRKGFSRLANGSGGFFFSINAANPSH